MKLASLIATLACSAACLFPSPDDTHLYACSSAGDCPAGQSCVAGTCAVGSAPGGSDGGGCSAPSCGGGGQIVLCDGGLIGCGAGATCDFGQCFPQCGGGCAAGTLCDQSASACVPENSCPASACRGGESCVVGICVAVPPGPAVDAGCQPADNDPDAGVTLNGNLALFPGADAATTLLDGGTVTLFFDGGSATSTVQLDPNSLPAYSFSGVPPGTATMLVSGAGIVPTYFPGLWIAPGTSRLDLEAVVSSSYLSSLPQATGRQAQAGQLLWVGQATTCNGITSAIGGYTVGLSPAPAFLGYYDSSGGPVLSSNPYSSTVYGEFVAYGAPDATTSYVLAEPGAALLSGTFAPPQSAIAVALIYPNFSQ